MPVIDINSYLGIPTAPPEQPVFRRTSQLASPFDQGMALVQQAQAVKSGRSQAALQAMLNQQEQIRAQANQLRLQQEAEQQAEQAAGWLSQVDPTSPTYRQDIAQGFQQTPLALGDRRVQGLMNVYNQSALAASQQRRAEQIAAQKAQQDAQKWGLRAMELGADREQVAKLVQSGDIPTLAQITGEARRASAAKKGSTQTDPALKGMKEAYDLLKEQRDYMDKQLIDTKSPEYVALSERINDLGGKLMGAYEGQFSGEEKAEVSTAATGKADTAVAPTKGSELSKVFAPSGVVATPEQIAKEIDSHIKSGAADENFYKSAIANKDLSLDQRKKALEKFREFAKAPPTDPSLTLNRVFERRSKLDEMLKEAEREVEMAPELEKANVAWNEAKGEIDSLVDKTAKRLGIPKQNLVNSLVAGERIKIPGKESSNVNQGGTTIPQLLEETWQAENKAEKKFGEGAPALWNKEAPQLEPLKNSKFASELGMKILGFIPKGKTYGDVLDAYLADKPTNSSRPLATQSPDLPRPSSPEEAAKLPPGTKFIGPDGTIRIVPPAR